MSTEFKKLNFKKTAWGTFNAARSFDNGLILSVSCGKGIYSTPRENMDSEKDFSSFEIAIFHEDHSQFLTSILDNHEDDVIGWVCRDDIDDIIKLISNISDKEVLDFINNSEIFKAHKI